MVAAPANTGAVSSAESIGEVQGDEFKMGPLEVIGSIQDEQMGSEVNMRDDVEHLTENDGAAELMINDDG